MRNIIIGIATLALFGLFGCPEIQQDQPNNDPTANPNLEQGFDVSDCGGFEPPSWQSDSAGDEDPPEDQECPEHIWWAYDAMGEGPLTFTLRNDNVLLNCCGDHKMAINEVGDASYVITEIDAPEGGDGRCECMCVFDYGVSTTEIPMGVIDIVVEREVTDSDAGMEEIWSGTIDLEEGSGEIFIQDNPFCE